MLSGAFFFAIMAACGHGLGDRCDWQVLAMVRSLIPLVVAFGLARAAGAPLVFWRPLTLWVRSVAGSLSLVCTFFALSRLPVSEVLTLSNLFPVWVALLSWPVLGLAPTADAWLGTVAGLLGVYLIQQPHFEQGNYAALAPLAASLCTSVAMLGLHHLHALDTRAIVVHFSFVALGFGVAAYALLGASQPLGPLFEPFTLVALLLMGLSATVGQFCLTKAFTTGAPAKVAVVNLSQVGFGMLIDVLIWHHHFNWQTMLGTLLVVAPTAWLLWRRT